MKKSLLGFVVSALLLASSQVAAEVTVKRASDAQSGADTTKLRVGLVVAAQPPRAYYRDADPTKPLTGYEVDILEQIAKRLRKDIVFYDVAWAGLFTGLLADKWDIG